MTHCVGFPAVAEPDARVLILGSLPGAESLRRQQYYAKPGNSFWFIMGELAGASPDLPYAERLARLRASRVALWDVCAAATRPGSLDASIVPASVVANDFAAFLAAHPAIRLIGHNGASSFTLYQRLVLPGLPAAAAAIPRVRLPSTSPAHASLRPAQKLVVWREVLGIYTSRP
jgi:hypoxanthine-DNA glycosylase